MFGILTLAKTIQKWRYPPGPCPWGC